MTQASVSAVTAGQKPVHSGRLWTHQIRAILTLEIRKALLGRRSIPMYFLGAMPVLILALRAVVLALVKDTAAGMAEASVFYAVVFQTFAVQFVVFFGCVAVFTNLFRGEVVDESLHFYFLTPVRREILAAGKYLAGVISTGVIFTGMTVVAYLVLYVPQGLGGFRDYFLGGPGLSHMLSYVGIVILACVGYGAVFLTIGLLFRNPVIPAALILGWELINFLLPSLLKKISVIHYLNSLCPVPVDTGPLALIAEPTSAWISVPGLLAVSGVLLAVSAFLVRRMQISYGKD